MRPLVIALQGSPELVSQSLRTLELCVDNLNQEFLEPIVSPVIDELMAALWKHLKPYPYNQVYSHTTLRILGKFGGRNRRTLKEMAPLQYKISTGKLSISIFLDGATKSNHLHLQDALAYASEVMSSNSSIEHRTYAFNFAKSCLPVIFDIKDIPLCSKFDSNCANIIARFKELHEETTQRMEIDIDPGFPFVEPLDVPRYHLDTLEVSLAQIMDSLFSACTIPELESEAWTVIENLCTFFALINIEECIKQWNSKEKPTSQQGYELLKTHALSRLNGFIDALVNTVTSDNINKREVGEKVLLHFHKIFKILLGDEKFTESIPAFRILASRFCSSCYQTEWFKKTGGCFGMSIICSKLNFSASWMLEYELEFVKALFFVLKDVPSNVTYFNLGDAKNNLELIIRKCHSVQDCEIPEEKARFNSLLALLISELPNANISVRETVQAVFQILADLKSFEITDLLLPVRERFLSPIYTKPLRALPFGLQIAFIDAITYCLNLRPVFLQFENDLVRLIHEALALADAEDQAFASKSSQFKSASAVVQLRVVCIKLLSAAMASPEFINSPNDTSTRSRIIAVFFKSLYSKNPEVVEVAFVGIFCFMIRSSTGYGESV
jgi:transformation/transcription domain-associated protein